MILIDANILIYAGVPSAPEHERVRVWLDDKIAGTATVGLPWHSLLAFLRITTNPRSVSHPVAMSAAWRQVEEWLACPTVWIPQPTERHVDVLATLMTSPNVRGNLVSDAHLAALAIEHDLTLCTNDRDFSRFASVRWLNPLAA